MSGGFRLTAGDGGGGSLTPDLWDLAYRHGLKPQRAGSRIRFFCPFCVQDAAARRKGRTASAAANIDGNPWICFRASCGATGNSRTLAAHLGEYIPSPGDGDSAPWIPVRPPPPKPQPTGHKLLDVDAAWQELIAATHPESVQRIVRWATAPDRRWPDDVAQAVAQFDDIACPMQGEGGGKLGRRLVREAERIGRRLLIPIRCERGIVRTVARRWAADGGLPPGRKSMSLPSSVVGSSEDWGGVWCYGSIPEAVEAARAGEPIYVVEGGPDYLATAGCLAVSNEPGAVLGLYNTTTARKLAEALSQSLGEANVIAPRVVLVPDINLPAEGEEHGAGMQAALQVADILRGRAGVFLCELPTTIDSQTADVSDHLAAHGVGDLVALLRTPRCLWQAPVSIEEAAAEMASRFERAILESTQRTSFGRRTVVVFQVPPGAGKTWTALGAAARVVSGDLPIPVNGRKPRGWPDHIDWPPQQRSVTFALNSHELAEEKERELAEISAHTPSTHLYGLLTHCHFADKVSDVYPSVGRRGVCGPVGDPDQRCPMAATCPGAQEPQARRGEVTFVPHAIGGRLKADLVIIDESPGVVATTTISGETIATLYACRLIQRVLTWRRFQNSAAGDAAAHLSDLVSPLARRHASEASSGNIDPFPRRISGQDLVDLIDSDQLLHDFLRTGYADDAKKPPVPFPAEVRTGFHAGNYMPSRPAFNAMRSLAAYYARLKGEADEEPDPLRVDGFDIDGRPVEPPKPVCAIRLDTDGSWHIEVRSVKPLPKAPVIILDATGDLTLDEWQAAYPDRRVVMRSLEVQGAAPASATHAKCAAGFSRRSMLDATGFVRDEAAPRICRALDLLAEKVRAVKPRTPDGPPAKIGLLTYKVVADALSGVEPASVMGGGMRLYQHMQGLESRGFRFKGEFDETLVGWFGRHDRGTNSFQGVDGFAVIGDPVGNLGDIGADAFLLGLDGDRIAGARTAATCRQAIARARHIRRDADDRVVLMFAGRSPPSVPGVVWRPEEMQDGVITSVSTAHLAELCYHAARVHGCLSVPIVQRLDREGTPWEKLDVSAIPRARLQRTVKKVAQTIGWGAHRIAMGGVSVVVYALDPVAAEVNA